MTIVPRKLLGDCRQTLKTLPDQSVHLIVTSPPYWRLRRYLPEGHINADLEIGQEATIEEYINHLCEVFDECYRVLRDDGTCWINLGDTYAGNSSGSPQTGLKKLADKWQPRKNPRKNSRYQDRTDVYVKKPAPDGIPLKNLYLLPSRVALALQQRGWIIRSMCPWIKANTMPESATDRPAVAIEYLFMLVKDRYYYYDRMATMVPASDNTHARVSFKAGKQVKNDGSQDRRKVGMNQRMFGQYDEHVKGKNFAGVTPKADGVTRKSGVKANEDWSAAHTGLFNSRGRRNSDWFMESFKGMLQDDQGDPMAFLVNPVGTRILHYASYPAKLIEPIILSGTSEKGCCKACGKQLRRLVENGEPDLEHQRACGGDVNGEYHGQATKDFDGVGVQNASDVKRRILGNMREKKTVGWEPTCKCAAPIVPATVLDPFAGTNTTGEVATRLGRYSIGCELSEEYFKASDIRDAQGGLALV